jgi:outer membrane protein assembly factor BamE (lipoprotein component of BamABCDE complex)
MVARRRAVDRRRLAAKVAANMRFARRDFNRLRPLAAVAAVALVAGCQSDIDQRGNLPPPYKLAEIHPGETTKDQVVKILGTPSSTGVFNDDSWYYISRKTKQMSFFDPKVLDQQVFVITFDDKGVVKAINHKDLADGRNIQPAPGATPAPGRELTFLEQIVGNIGRFNKSSGGGGGGSDNGPARTGGPNPYDPYH